MDDSTYTCALAEFVHKSVKRWATQKKDLLEPKLTRNFNAVTNREYRMKMWKKGEAEGWRSKTWIGFVRVKIWAFYAMMLDTVLKAGKIPFSLEPSPYDAEIQDEAMIQDRNKRIEKMTDLIEQQLNMRKADREYMKKWLSGGYYGMAFSKFNVEPIVSMEFVPVPMDIGPAGQYMSPEESAQYIRYEMKEIEEAVPGHRYVSIWNMVWDMDAENFVDGDGYAEIIRSSAYDLKQLVGKPGYIDTAIKEVIAAKRHEDGDDKGDNPAEHPGKEGLSERRKKFARYEFNMRVPKRFAAEFEQILKSGKNDIAYISLIGEYEEAEESGDDIEIMGEIVDRKIIRYIRNESGKRPHKMWVVEQNLDESTGTGIADNMEDVQASLVGMIRAFEDNKKLSANVTSAVKERYFKNPSQLDDIIPGKKYDIADSCDDVRKAFMPIVHPDVGETLVSGISLMIQLKDDVSMIPTIMQGFNLPKHQPDTAYEMRQLTENAGKYIGQAIRNNDEQFIEPEIRDIYEYNMLFGEDESCKVNCKVYANGFTSFQNKEIRGERMRMALSMFVATEVLLPYVKIKPHLDVIYESMDEDPDKFIKSEEEMMQEAQAQAEMQAEAEQKAIRLSQMEAEHEAALKITEQAQKHGQDMEKSKVEHVQELNKVEAEHIDDMEEMILKAKLDRIYGQPKPREAKNDL
uniref:Putative portal protein n=1 Tax=viral metagenome TaxID=1070528 RepID=A0A6M3KIN3_9ZZZZ